MEDDKKKNPQKKTTVILVGWQRMQSLFRPHIVFHNPRELIITLSLRQFMGFMVRFHIGRQNNLDNVSERDMSSSSSGRS